MSGVTIASAPETTGRAHRAYGLRSARLGGEFTAGTAGRLRNLFCQATARGETRLILDLHAVTAMDACGVAALLYGQRALDAEGGRLVLRANRIVAWALKESGTVPAFEIWNGAGM